MRAEEVDLVVIAVEIAEEVELRHQKVAPP